MKRTERILTAAAGNGPEMIRYVEASGTTTSNLARVDGIAYSGGRIRQAWSEVEMVVDLSGMDFPPQIPLLYNHMNWPDFRLGAINAEVKPDGLKIAGGIDQDSEYGRSVVESGRKYQWQLSIGAEVLASERVPEGENRQVNGKSFAGPFLHVTRSRLREVSVVAVGADAETHLRIAASLNISMHAITNQGVTMNQKLREFILAKYSLGAGCDEAAIRAFLATVDSSVEKEDAAMKAEAAANPQRTDAGQPELRASAGAGSTGIPAVVTAGTPPSMTPEQVKAAAQAAAAEAVASLHRTEQERIDGIMAAATEYPELQQQAVRSGWSVDYTNQVVSGIKAQIARLPRASGNIIVRSGPDINAKALEAALCLRAGIDEKQIIGSCGQQAIEAGDHIRGMSLKELMVEACRVEGKSVPVGFSNETIRAAFSTVTLPGILNNVANKTALRAFAAQPVIALQLCSIGDLTDFKEAERYRLTDIGDLEPVSADGELKNGSLGEDKATNKLETFGKLFTLSRTMILNDDLGEFLKVPAAMGNRGARKIDQLFFKRLLENPVQRDGKALFCADHRNYTGGANSVLGVDSLEKAVARFLEQVDSDEQPISVQPKFLLVPTVLYPLAQRLTRSTILIGGTEASPAQNVISDYNLTPVVSPYLTNSKYEGHSDTGFYLFADPNQVDTFEIGYLQGKRTPTVEHGNTDFASLGMAFRVYFDVGVREQDHRGMSFNKGKA